ncbi:MAG: helix-turn-helix domain-containing protein [Clostridia bacterium]|nr:helix-turn-helix domain-containing protein [Clostridia bacterium]
MEKFYERLKELRIEKGLTQDQLAQETGLSRSAIGFWENGQRIPLASVIVVLAKYFNVSTDYLLGVVD